MITKEQLLKIMSSQNRMNILRFLEDSNSFENIRSEFNLNNNTASFHLKKLLDFKLIEKKNKKYHITNFGKMLLTTFDNFNELLNLQKL